MFNLIFAVVLSVFGCIMLGYCWFKSDLSFRKNTLSDCAFGEKSKLFSWSLAIFGVSQTIYSYDIAASYFSANPFLVLVPIIAGVLLIIAAVFDKKKHLIIHKASTYTMFMILIVWSVVFNYYLADLFGVLPLLISAVLAGLTFLTYYIFGPCAIPEIVFIAGVIIWDAYIALVIYV